MACLNIFKKKRKKEKSHFIFLSLLISAKIGNFRSSSTAKWICKRAWKGIYAHDLEKNKWFYRVNNTTSGNRMTFPYYYRHFYFPKLIYHTQCRSKLTDYCCLLLITVVLILGSAMSYLEGQNSSIYVVFYVE